MTGSVWLGAWRGLAAVWIAAACILAMPANLAEASGEAGAELVILADRDDPYYTLAEEIAAAESAAVLHSLAEVIAERPVFLLWVVSPGFLSDEEMIGFGMAMKDSPVTISTGLITASSMEGARKLWQRRMEVRNTNLYAANGPNPSAHIPTGRLMGVTPEGTTQEQLSAASFRKALAAADYLTFTGHGGSGYLRINDTTRIVASEIPRLGPVVIATGSCQTLRPWEEDAIALGMVDQGAAAYSGFVYSPNEGYLIGEFDGLPFRYTWPEFPIGHAIQAQNRGTLQGFALFPYQVLIGDPRIALQSGPPYELVEDRKEGDGRTITYAQLPAGIVPIRVGGGADYDFVEADGISAAAQADRFYNSRLQWANFGEDKYILIEQPGGNLTLRLRRQADWYWFIGDFLFDSLDHTLIYLQDNAGDYLTAGFAMFPLLWAGWQFKRKRLEKQKIGFAVIFGLGMALAQLGYVVLRLDDITITSKPAALRPLGIAAAFGLAMSAGLIHSQARSGWGKLCALLVVSFPGWMPAVFSGALIGATNQLGFVQKLGVPLYNQALGLLPLGSFAVLATISGLILGIADRQHGYNQRGDVNL